MKYLPLFTGWHFNHRQMIWELYWRGRLAATITAQAVVVRKNFPLPKDRY